MRRNSILLLFIFIGTYSFGHSTLMYISAKPITCLGYSYEIEITQHSYVGSDVVFGGIEIVYGDGIYEEFPKDDFVISEIINNRVITKYVKKHVFQGPGIYKINARFFNRGSKIQNMSNSVNTPFYVATVIHIDPYLGCNHTPVLENFPVTNKSGSNYFYDLSFIDEENDSLSFHITTPLQDHNIPVVNYWFPVEKDNTGSINISKLSIDQFNCSLQWNSKSSAGEYTVAIKVIEWRKVDGIYYQISSSTLDYQIDLQETENQYAKITGLEDTAIIAGNNFTKNISITDPDGDSIQVGMYGDFFKLMDVNQNEEMVFLPGPIEKSINFTPLSNQVRAKPYKTVFTATDNNDSLGSLSNIASMYIWVADRDHEPDPPKNFIGQAISKDLVNIYWNDSDDELGYIVERADLHFTEFERIVILPANATSFNDSSVVENNTYQYRITAVGTEMSVFRTTEVSTPDIITALGENDFGNNLKIFPNPSNGSFKMINFGDFIKIEMINLSGKKVWEEQLNRLDPNQSILLSTGLPKGIYILHVNSNNRSYCEKIIIN